jgi:medium-chain acyl-[acyl-carrier-protein] hydrolase
VLLCFPHAGGAASAYQAWPGALAGSGIEVWPVQLPGREQRYPEPPLTDLAAMTATLTDAVFGHLAGRPYGLYGHSAGAEMACAFARHTAACGLPAPRWLFVGACRPPQHPDPDFPIHRMAHDRLLAKLLSYGGIPAEVMSYPDLIEPILAITRADLQLVETHEGRDRALDCPVTAIGGVADQNVPVTLLPAWQSITRGPFQTVLLPGGHFRPPSAERQLMRVLSHALC